MTKMARAYSLPERATTHIDSVTRRCENLIGAGIWSGLEIQQLRAWLDNFDTQLARYFAIRVLDNLIYRSDLQTAALINQLFHRQLPELLASLNINLATPLNIIEALQDKAHSPIRLVPVVRENDAPSKSGPTVLRLIKRSLDLSERWNIFPSKINSKHHRDAEIIIFIDDFLGTGYQFSSFLKWLKRHQNLDGKRLVYAPLVAHERGIDRLKRAFPELALTYAERVDDSHNLFDAASSDGVNSPAEMRVFYEAYLTTKGFHLVPRRQLGYGSLGLCLAFEHATPNASLPLLWLQTHGFVPLFKR